MKRIAQYFALALVAIFHPVATFAQGERVAERLYIATDKGSYVAGERIWCSLYCFLAPPEMELSDFSSTAYIELQSENQVVLTAKVALVLGRGAGAIEIPPTLPTGNYKLLGYTAQQRNEEGFSPEERILTIYNTLSPERVEGGVQLVEEGSPDAASEQNENRDSAATEGVELLLPPAEVKKGEEFTLTLRNKRGDPATMSLSVYHKNRFGGVGEQSIADFAEKVGSSTVGEVTGNYLPDYEGEVVRLKVEGERGDMLHVSFPGSQVNYYASDIDSAGGAFVVTPNIYGDRDMVCEGGEQISLEDPFMRVVTGGIPKLRVYPEMEEELTRRGFSMQVGRRFDADTLYERLPVRPNILLDADKEVYILDDYTRFPKMEEVLSEFVGEIKVRSVKKEKQLSIMVKTLENTYFTNGYSLILLDGVPVTDQAKILDYDPLLLHRIEIYTGMYSVGNIFYEGMANFITYKGDMSGFQFGEQVKIISYKGAQYPLAFTGESIREGGAYPDYRETIYWHPVIEMDGAEEREIRCIAPMYSGDFEIVLEGVSTSGSPIFYKSTLKIR